MATIAVIQTSGSVPKCIILEISGNLHASPTGELNERLGRTNISRLDPRPMVIDLTGVSWMNTDGLAGLVALYQARNDDCWRTVIVSPPNSRVRRLLETTKLDTAIPVYAARADALAALSALAPP